MPTKILLTDTSWWPCASRLAMSLTKAGCSVSAVYPLHGHPLAKTSVLKKRFPYRALDPATSVRAAIDAFDPDLIVPCNDRAVSHLHEVHARACLQQEAGAKVRRLIEKSIGSPESFPIVSSRYQLLEVAREEGIRIPRTIVVNSPRQLHCGDNALELPWVLKADGSWGGHGVKIAHNPKQAEQCYLELCRPLTTARFLKRLIVDRDPYWFEAWRHRVRPSVIAQSLIDGRPANSAVVCWQGKILAGIAVEVVNAQGMTGSATIVRLVDRPQMLDASERLARRLNLSGMFGLDFMIEETTGDHYLIEMNPRATPLSHLQLGTGRDLISALYAQLSGARTREKTLATDVDTIAYFPQAWHWDPKSELLQSSFHDVPWEEPELVQELSRLPYPDRSILARVANMLRRKTFEHRAARGGVFESALTNHKSVEARSRHL